jgi:DNA modification methylase
MGSPITFLDGRVTLHCGDCLAVLKTLPDDSVDCVVTSPPYWGLRDYGVDGQLGLEPTLGEHLDAMIAVFDEVRRVLKPTGTCFVNYGDCYATSVNGRSAADTKAAGNDDRTFRDKPFSTVQGAMKPKDLCMVPNRFAIAMQESGWWVRSEIIWAKPNPMPESVTDRPATSHEKIWLFTKSGRYDWDAGAVRQIQKYHGLKNQDESGFKDPRSFNGKHKEGYRSSDKQRGHSRRHADFNDRWDLMSREEQQANGRNLRNYEPAPVDVWNIATQPFSEAHFATFPVTLAERAILAGCPKGGVVLDPFGGSGTTALAALRHGRTAQLIELNPEYAAMARKRIEREWKVFQEPSEKDFGPLFREAV